jgi:hypothetical protein
VQHNRASRVETVATDLAVPRSSTKIEAATNSTRYDENTNRPVISRLHPRIYRAVIVFTAWFALAVWGFAGPGITDYLLLIVSGFLSVVVAMTLILSQVGRNDPAATADDKARVDANTQSLRDWAASDFVTWQDRLSGLQAAILILLPFVAAAIGMTAFAIIFHIAEHSA